MTLPCRPRGRPTPAATAAYEAEIEAFCASILKIGSRLDFRVSSRGWGYLLEQNSVITKDQLDAAQDLVNDCRKSGDLPLDICAVDDKRATDGIEYDHGSVTIEEAAQNIIDRAERAIDDAVGYGHQSYVPFGFWSQQHFYVEIAVEKIDLKSLFGPVARHFRVPITNLGGWCDINARADMMKRFAYWEHRGKLCVLLYCGDHDPGGLHISDFIRKNFADLSRAVGWEPNDLIIDRFGLNFDFIEQHGLTWIDNLVTGGRGKIKDLADPQHPDHRKFYVQDYLRKFGARKCEANALVIQPEAGRQLCREAIQKYITVDDVNRYNRDITERRQDVHRIVAKHFGRAVVDDDDDQ